MITVRHPKMAKDTGEAAEPAWQSQKIGIEAIKAARIAAGYRGVSLQEYLTEVVLEAANYDVEQGHADYRRQVAAPSEPPRGRRPKKPG